MLLVDYNSLFAPARSEVLAAITALAPAAVGIFAVIIGIRIGVSLLNHFTSGGDVEDEE